MKKILKVEKIELIVDNTSPILAQCIKAGFNREWYDCEIHIGAWYVKWIANYDWEYLFSFNESTLTNALNIAIQKIVTNLFDNINKHAGIKSTETSRGLSGKSDEVQKPKSTWKAWGKSHR